MNSLFRLVLVILILFLPISHGCSGLQVAPTASQEELVISRVLNIPGKSKAILYRRAKIWIAQNYNSANDVIQYSDRQSGTIICRGSMKLFRKSALGPVDVGYLSYTLTINIKDSKLRMIFDHFYSYIAPSGPPYNVAGGKQIPLKMDMEYAKPRIENLVASLKAFLSGSKNEGSW